MHCQFADGALPIRRRPILKKQEENKATLGEFTSSILLYISIDIIAKADALRLRAPTHCLTLPTVATVLGGYGVRWSDSHEAAAAPAFFSSFGVKKKRDKRERFWLSVRRMLRWFLRKKEGAPNFFKSKANDAAAGCQGGSGDAPNFFVFDLS